MLKNGRTARNSGVTFSVFSTCCPSISHYLLQAKFIRILLFMSGNMSCPSVLLLRSLRLQPIPRQCSQRLPLGGRRALHTSPKFFSNEERTFRSQLYESTARRIQAQREAEARFAAASPTSNSARRSAFTFGTHASAGQKSTADFSSNCLLVRASLLVRIYET